MRRGTSAPDGFARREPSRSRARRQCRAARAHRASADAANRVAAAAAFALEDKLAGPAQAQHLVASPRQRDGAVDVAIAARDLFAPLARDFTRVVAEPALAPLPPAGTWRWHASAPMAASCAGPTAAPSAVGAEPGGAAAARACVCLTHATRAAAAPAQVDVAFPVDDAALARVVAESGVDVHSRAGLAMGPGRRRPRRRHGPAAGRVSRTPAARGATPSRAGSAWPRDHRGARSRCTCSPRSRSGACCASNRGRRTRDRRHRARCRRRRCAGRGASAARIA